MRAGIFGIGQAGNALLNLISSQHEIIVCFDNDNKKWKSSFSGIKIENPDKLHNYKLDIIWTGTLNESSAEKIEEQIRCLGFNGNVRHACELRRHYDLRLSQMRLISKELESNDVKGAVAELGVYKGEFAKEINRSFPNRNLYLFDTFEGFSQEDLSYETELSRRWFGDFTDTDEQKVMKKMHHPDMVTIFKGRFPETVPDKDIRYAFVSIDADLYQPTLSGLKYFYKNLSEGGVILLHDYNSKQFPGVKKATEEFRRKESLLLIPLPDFHGTAMIIKERYVV